VLLRAGGIPRTPSGKVQRRICQAQFRDGTLERSAQSE
jgi:acyl-CoA synthetase (AMP-forming)/AMP-acid ligase II